jgi:uncharacterized membrane protein
MAGLETGAIVGGAVTLALVLADIIKKLVDRLLTKKNVVEEESESCEISRALATELSKVPETQRDILDQLKAISDNSKETSKLQRECLRIIDRIELRLENKKS